MASRNRSFKGYCRSGEMAICVEVNSLYQLQGSHSKKVATTRTCNRYDACKHNKECEYSIDSCEFPKFAPDIDINI